MNALDQLNSYLRRMEARLRMLAFSRGAAAVAGCALLITVALVLIVNRFAFSQTSLLWARILLFVAIALAAGYGLIGPLLKVNRRRAAREAENKFPEFQERLLTVAEAEESATASQPFVQLLAADTMRVAQSRQPEKVAPSGRIAAFWGSAGVATAVLLWLILAGPGFLGYGTALLWAGTPKAGAQPFYYISVQPGNKTVRRKSDQLITAHLGGFSAEKVRLYAQYRGTTKWEQVNMTAQPQGNGFEFLFGGLADTVSYYVEAGAVRSQHYTLKAVDLPAVKKIRVTYHYPAWAGLKDATEDPGGDLRALEGTVADVEIVTDKPLAKGLLMFGDDSQMPLTAGQGNTLKASVPIKKDGMYHVAGIQSGENVRLSEDYFIEARKDEPPVIKIDRPGRDAKVSPIEEVTVAVQGSDDYGLKDLALHFSVNGGEEKTVPLLAKKGEKSVNATHVIPLEDYKLTPGDIVSVYASGRDAQHSVKTDMFFIQTEPYEREYSQSQQMGGGGGGGGQNAMDNEISEREKEIIAATWNEDKNASKNTKQTAEDAKFLADTQSKLGEQANKLAERMKSRELTGTNQEFANFAEDMRQASAEMTQATGELKGEKWTGAMPHEQKALQHILRAEATFRQIQVAFGSRGGGGGGGGSMGRDLANLFDLELDTEKNQYETGQNSSSSSSDPIQQQIDKALDRLKQLAKRQEELAQQSQKQAQTFQQRWEQEMLRREAEELKRQMEQLSRGQSGQQSASSQQQGQQGQQSGQQGQQGQQSGQQGQQGQQSASSRGGQSGRTGAVADPRLQETLQRLQQATDEMRKAASGQQGGSPEQNAASQRRAAQQLQEAQDILNGMRHQEASNAMGNMAQQAEQLDQRQKELQQKMRQAFGGKEGDQSGDDSLNDPGSYRGFGRRGRYGQQQFRQGPTSAKDEELAGEKEKLAGDLQKLERQMQETARQLRDSQPGVSSKLRDALSEAQQNELDMRMKKSAEWIRQGQGMYAWMRESTVTMGLDKLHDQLQQVQGMMQNLGPDGNPNNPAKDKASEALNRVENLRAQLERMAQARNGQPGNRQGNQQGQGQQGQNQQGQQGQGQQGQGQQGGNQAGQQGGNSQQAGGGAPGGAPGYNGGAYGNRNGQFGYNRGPLYGDRGQVGPYFGGNYGIRDAIRDLTIIRQDQALIDPETGRQLEALEQQMQRLEVGDVSSPLLSDRISREVLPEVEQLELKLRQKVDLTQGGVRTMGSDPVPTGYSDAVAEYFRRLSKAK